MHRPARTTAALAAASTLARYLPERPERLAEEPAEGPAVATEESLVREFFGDAPVFESLAISQASELQAA